MFLSGTHTYTFVVLVQRPWRAMLQRHVVTVCRDGHDQKIPGDEVVKDDLVRLMAGDQVVADGRLACSAPVVMDDRCRHTAQLIFVYVFQTPKHLTRDLFPMAGESSAYDFSVF